MYLQVYFHKTSVACEAMLQNIAEKLSGYHLPANADEYFAIDEYNIQSILLDVAKHAPAKVQENIVQLLSSRVLWKRVYEVTGAHPSQNSALNVAERVLKDMNVDYQIASSATHLTRFKSREENEASKNYLRLIKKDRNQIPIVTPIEDHSNMISNNEKYFIRRIYCQVPTNNDLQLVKDRIFTALLEDATT